MPDSCATCRAWKQLDPAKPVIGECRRHAPVVIDRSWTSPTYGLQAETATVWPQTLPTDWCFDYQPPLVDNAG